MEFKDYKLITTAEGIREYIGVAKRVAFDFEAAPDDPYRDDVKAALDPARSHIVGCSFSVSEGSGIYVPVAHRKGPNIDRDAFFRFLKEFLVSPSIQKIAHNLAYESMMAYARGIVIQEPVFDTICAAQLTLRNNYEFRRLSDSGLKTLAAELCGEALPSFGDVTAGRHFDELDPEDAETIRYGAADADFALRLHRIFCDWFDQYLPRHRFLTEEIESPTAVYIGIMRCNGIPLDLSLMMEKKRETEAEIARLRSEIRGIIGDVDIGSNCSTAAFKNTLYRDLQLPVLKVTESNREAADDMTLQMLTEWCRENRPELSPLFSLVQEYRKQAKILSTYIVGYLRYLNPVTGRLHPEMTALSTDTGRMNCRNPNCQNMPRRTSDPVGVRNFLRAPDGQLVLSLDFSQIELRVGTFYCRDEVMLDTYRRDGDIHAATTAVLFGLSYEDALDKHRETYKEYRTIAKNVNFGFFYGLFANGLQKTLKYKAGVEKSLEECREILYSLRDGYPGLSRWQDAARQEAARRMYTETWLGKRRYLPDIRSGDWKRRSFAERCALNTPIQGTAAEILKLAVTRVLCGLPDRPWLKPILQIHDELTFLVPEERLDEAVRFVRACMEQQPFPEFDLPLIAEASAGPTFGSMEELE